MVYSVSGFIFSRYFFLLRERFFGLFYFYIFLYIFPLEREVFWGFYVEKIFVLFPFFPLKGLGFLRDGSESHRMFGTNIFGWGASVTPRGASSPHRGDGRSCKG
jgi:hypothetical protein